MITACRNCGVAVDPELVTPKPGRSCPVCKAPLDEKAVELSTFEASNPGDGNDDPRRSAARDQAKADIAQMRAAAIDPGAIANAVEQKVTAAIDAKVSAAVASAVAAATVKPATP